MVVVVVAVVFRDLDVLVLALVTEAVATVLLSSRNVTVFIEPSLVPSNAVTVPVKHTSIECTGVALGNSR